MCIPSIIAKGMSWLPPVPTEYCYTISTLRRCSGHCCLHGPSINPYTLVLKCVHTHAQTQISTPEVYKPLTFSHDFSCPLFQTLIRFSHTNTFINASALKEYTKLPSLQNPSLCDYFTSPKVQETGIQVWIIEC